jgi:hypothetical protein
MLDRDTLINDIPEDIARRAHAGTSFSPEDRARSERAGYADTMLRDFEALAKYADTDDKRATLAAEFERYRDGYRTRYLAMLAAKSRCMSTMITGGSNFPVRRQAKIGDVADKRTRELVEFRERALDAIRKTLRPELRPIMAGDDNATDRIADKIAKLERVQEIMKAANQRIRLGGDSAAIVADLIALGLSEKNARNAVTPDPMGRLGFPSYALSNNSAEIRRLKKRATVVTEAKATEATEIEGTNARLEDAPADNRVRLYFPGKPEAVVRARLKSQGFRWAPSLGCWQAYRNNATLATARHEAGLAGVVESTVAPESPTEARCACHEGRHCNTQHDPATCSFDLCNGWTCHARPAATGLRCGHFNKRGGEMFNGLEVCAGCGCTKKASDDRAARAAS